MTGGGARNSVLDRAWRAMGGRGAAGQCEECGSPEVLCVLTGDDGDLHAICDPCFTAAIEAGAERARRARGEAP